MSKVIALHHRLRTCNELGLCQRRKQACDGCTWKQGFAPGVIDGPHSAKRKSMRLRTFLALACVGFTAGSLVFVAWIRWFP